MRGPDVFGAFLRDNRRGVLGWSAGVAAVTALYTAFWPSMRESGAAMAALTRQMPEIAEAMGWSDLSTPEGYLRGTVFSLLTPILVTVASIAVGARAIAGDEEEGGLELVLAHPVSRARVLWQRFAALAAFDALLGAAVFAVPAVLDSPLELGIGLAELAAAAAAVALAGLCHGAAALALGAATGRRAYAIGGAAVLAAVGYLGNTLALQVEELEWLRFGSAFYYALGPDPLTNGLDPGFTAVLVAAPVALVALAGLRFDRRDVLV